MVAYRQRKTIGKLNDNSEYRAVIERDALFLIAEGKKLLAKANIDYSDTDEEEITGDLTEATNEFINCLSSPDWTSHYYAQEELRENTKGKKGKHRKRVDIVCVLTGRKPHQKIKFEAKRLRTPGFPASKYVGKTGLGEFISGNYAQESQVVGMIGYVQSDNPKLWAGKLSEEILKEKKSIRLAEKSRWQKANVENIDHCYTTSHNRVDKNKELIVYHLLLDFTSSPK
jgi:hypothetical protein